VEEKKSIILKVKHKNPFTTHVSSWKVAYADFVTGLMAFFLLMWLMAMVSPTRRAELSKYFKEYTPVAKGTQTKSQEQKAPTLKAAQEPPPAPSTPSTEKLRSDLTEIIKGRLGDLKDQVLVDTFEAGVRVQVIDKQGHPIFDLGSVKLTPDAQKAMKVIAESIRGLENKIAVEGHTDALSYSSSKYTNWELSTDRASAARKELERHGLNPDSLIKVAGYAAVDPLIKENPYAPQNRRISILIYDQSKSQPWLDEKTPLKSSLEKAPEEVKAKPGRRELP
jgi:chemotaxis protein MotB